MIQVRFNFPKHYSDPDKSSEIFYVEKCIDFKNVACYFNKDRELSKYNYLDYEFEFNEKFQLQTQCMNCSLKRYEFSSLGRAENDNSLN